MKFELIHDSKLKPGDRIKLDAGQTATIVEIEPYSGDLIRGIATLEDGGKICLMHEAFSWRAV